MPRVAWSLGSFRKFVSSAALLPGDLMFLAPVARDLPESFRAECKPCFLDTEPPDGVLEMPEGTGAMDRARKVGANTIGFHGTRKILHDSPLVNIELRRQRNEAILGCRDPFGGLPFLFLPVREVRFLGAGLLRRVKKRLGDGDDLTSIEIQSTVVFVNRHLQSLDDIVQLDSYRHFHIILLPARGRKLG